jgi:uncharacterized protein YjbJ (UPF0337 family)
MPGTIVASEREREPVMSLHKKAKNKAKIIKGKTKQHVGQATGNKRLKRQGKADELIGTLKNAGEKVMDAFKRWLCSLDRFPFPAVLSGKPAIRTALAERAPTAIIIPSDVQVLEHAAPTRAFKMVPSSIGVDWPTALPGDEAIMRAADVLNSGSKVAILAGRVPGASLRRSPSSSVRWWPPSHCWARTSCPTTGPRPGYTSDPGGYGA